VQSLELVIVGTAFVYTMSVNVSQTATDRESCNYALLGTGS